MPCCKPKTQCPFLSSYRLYSLVVYYALISLLFFYVVKVLVTLLLTVQCIVVYGRNTDRGADREDIFTYITDT